MDLKCGTQVWGQLFSGALSLGVNGVFILDFSTSVSLSFIRVCVSVWPIYKCWFAEGLPASPTGASRCPCTFCPTNGCDTNSLPYVKISLHIIAFSTLTMFLTSWESFH